MLPTKVDIRRAQDHVILLLEEVEVTLTGWVLKNDKEKIEKLLEPLRVLTDK